MMVQRLLLAAVAALNCCSRSVAIDSSAPRYLLSRAEPYTVPSDGTVMLHNDLWWIGALTADSKFEEIAAASKYNYTASIGIGINHPPNSVNTAARYFNSWGEQALQQQSPGSSSSGDDERTMTDGTGVNFPFHPELWPQLDQYFEALADTMFVKHKIPRSAVKVPLPSLLSFASRALREQTVCPRCRPRYCSLSATYGRHADTRTLNS